MVEKILHKNVGPKIKFYLFPLTRPTLKKRPYSKKIISIFSQDFSLNFIANLETCLMQAVSSLKNILSKLFEYLILLPIEGG